ncbi:looped-hinge helix DNA binding domain-containing protein, AbrB family [Dehalogenimonas formicexedens]|uniref:Looped-hinge helix DNA binding domain-containing protein, AbrB family n=1 Tax=Dehalogenimonas formicexedens TaxID=1839801 RepID=A0A1P8F5C7_9CHLR|nr:AbrB/MazE/SpoVT family DNA-binding domain-containing protein [Dehalogenimonas formicexedens]APV43696.1 looped-hinge helix DNA binding domain-containing protein, AbrB family [Dehalogenimonas formicexedens]
MEHDFNGVWSPKFYGSTTIGERGQMVIPAEARKDFDITPASKLLVFGSGGQSRKHHRVSDQGIRNAQGA